MSRRSPCVSRSISVVTVAILAMLLWGVRVDAQNLVGYWTFDEGVADDGPGGIQDLASDVDQHNATSHGVTFDADVPMQLTGDGARSLDLTQGDFYAIVDSFTGDAKDDDFNLQTLTVSCWVKGFPGSWNPFVSKRGESGQGWQLRRHGGDNEQTFTLRGHGNDDPRGTININNDDWKHLVGTYDGATRRFYVNGLRDYGNPESGPVNPTYCLVVFGGRDNDPGNPATSVANFSDIKLDDIAIWEGGLSDFQVAHLATGGDPRELPGSESPGTKGWRVKTVLAIRPGTPQVNTLTEVDRLMAAEGKFSTRDTAVGDIPTADIEDDNQGNGGRFGDNNKLPAPFGTNGRADDDFAMVGRGVLNVITPGTYSVAIGGDDGGRLRIDFDGDGIQADGSDDVIVDDSRHGFSDRYGNATFDDAGLYEFEWTGFERGGGAAWEFRMHPDADRDDGNDCGGGGCATADNGWSLVGDNEGPMAGLVELDGVIEITIYKSPINGVPEIRNVSGTLPDLSAGSAPYDDRDEVTGTTPTADLVDDDNAENGRWNDNNLIPAPYGNNGEGDDDYMFLATGMLTVDGDDLEVTFAIAGDDGGALQIDLDGDGLSLTDPEDAVLIDDDLHGYEARYLDVTFPAAGDYAFGWIGFERGGGAGHELAMHPELGQTNGNDINADNGWHLVGAGTFADSGATAGPDIQLMGDGLEVTLWKSLSDVTLNAPLDSFEKADSLRAGEQVDQVFEELLDALNLFQSGGHGRFPLAEDAFPGLSPGPRTENDDFLVEATGFLIVEENSKIVFGTTVDDAGRLRIDLDLDGVIATDGSEDVLTKFCCGEGLNAPVNLLAGEYAIEYVGWERGGGAYFEVFADTTGAGDFNLLGNEIGGGLEVLQESSPIPRVEGLTSQIAGEAIQLDWDLPAQQPEPVYDGFRVFRDGQGIADVPDDQSTFTDDSVLPGIEYCYVVRATLGEQLGSSSVRVCETPPVPAPSNLTAVAGDTQVDLSWMAPAGAPQVIDGYRIDRDSVEIATVPADQITFTDGPLENGVEVCYQVRATKGKNLSDPTNEACATPGKLPVTFVRGDADSNGSINLTDGIVILNFLFLGAVAPACLDAADTDDDGGQRPSLTDAVIIFSWLFSGGPPPAVPSPDGPNYVAENCGPDVMEDGMDCAMLSPVCDFPGLPNP